MGDLKPYRQYADGKPRPFFRGRLHGFITVVILMCIVGASLLIVNSVLSLQWWRLVFFLFGKFISYAASSALHLYPFKTKKGVTDALRLDLIAVPISIWATSSPLVELWDQKEFAIGLFFSIANCVLVWWQFKGHVGLETPKHRTDVPREILIIIQFARCIIKFKSHFGLSKELVSAIMLYLTGFACSAPVTHAHETEAMLSYAPHHARQIWGLHEDFHVFLFAADVAMMLMGASYIAGLGSL